MAAVGGLFEVCRSLTHHNHAFILYIDPPCTTTAEYTFSKRLNSLIFAIYHQTNIRVDPFVPPRSLVDQVAKRVHLAWGPHASSDWKDFGHVRKAWKRDQDGCARPLVITKLLLYVI